jgi:exodeoxyribonuclease-5
VSITKSKGLSLSDLSPDQADAHARIDGWLSDADRAATFTLAGYAGTGKTTVTSVFALHSNISPIAFVAFTGKAASVLGRKLREVGVTTINKTRKERGPDAAIPFSGGYPYNGTIHSLIYIPCVCLEPRKKGEPPIERPCKDCGDKRYVLRETLDRDYQLIVVDEASMVSEEMLQDLLSFGIPILGVGDHGQLPPVKGAGSLMRRPDVRLERIHRQAERNPIIALSKAIRETGTFDTRFDDGRLVRFGRTTRLHPLVTETFGDIAEGELFDTALICATNKRRIGLNQMARKARGISGPPRDGEQVIALRNMRAMGVYNGMRGILRGDSQLIEASPWLYQASVEFPEEQVRPQEFAMCGHQFNREKTFDDVEAAREEIGADIYSWAMLGALFDFGYAMTCHKAQGSGWEDVIVVADGLGWMDADTARRWRYTAITRASERLTVLT